MAVAGTPLVPGTQTGMTLAVVRRTVESGTYQRLKFIKIIEETERLYNQLTMRKYARVTGTTLGQTADGTGLTYLNIIGTPVTLTPIGSVVPVAWSANYQAQTDVSLDRGSSDQIEMALAELTEAAALANVTAGTEIMTMTGIDGPSIRQATARLQGNTNGVAEVGGNGPQMYGIFTHKQLPNLGNIPEYNNAEVRGDSETPYVKGVWMRGGGLMLVTTTVITNDANGDHNCVFIPSAFVISWNVRSEIRHQDVEMQNRAIAYNNVGSGILHNARLLDVRTTTSAL